MIKVNTINLLYSYRDSSSVMPVSLFILLIIKTGLGDVLLLLLMFLKKDINKILDAWKKVLCYATKEIRSAINIIYYRHAAYYNIYL